VSVGGCGRDLSLVDHAFHGAHGRIRKDHRQAFNEALQKTNHDLELTQCHIVVVETGQEQDVFARNEVVGCESTNFDIVGAIWELSPNGWVERKSIGVFLEDGIFSNQNPILCQISSLWATNRTEHRNKLTFSIRLAKASHSFAAII
jgi:hypothetical protein